MGTFREALGPSTKLCVWTKRQYRYVPLSLSITFVDDSNSIASSSQDLELSLDQTTRFDRFSGQRIHPGKVVGLALSLELHDAVSRLLLDGKPLFMHSQVKPCR